MSVIKDKILTSKTPKPEVKVDLQGRSFVEALIDRIRENIDKHGDRDVLINCELSKFEVF